MSARRDLRRGALPITLLAAAALVSGLGAGFHQSGSGPISLSIAKIYWEYNASANDLGIHVRLDGEDWKRLKIVKPGGQVVFTVEGRAGYARLGLTELFFEGAEPSLDEFPLAELLALFPEGEYDFDGKTVDGATIEGEAVFSHAIPSGPDVAATVGPNDSLVISWNAVTSPPPGFPNRPIDVVGYQVIVGSFQVTVPSTTFSVTVSPEFVASLPAGPNPFEVLAIDASGNQSITEGTFTL